MDPNRAQRMSTVKNYHLLNGWKEIEIQILVETMAMAMAIWVLNQKYGKTP